MTWRQLCMSRARTFVDFIFFATGLDMWTKRGNTRRPPLSMGDGEYRQQKHYRQRYWPREPYATRR